MNNEGFRRLMQKERERREALKAKEAEQIKKESEQITEDVPEDQEDIKDVITDSENGDNEQDTES